jgi:transposase InsO family protein
MQAADLSQIAQTKLLHRGGHPHMQVSISEATMAQFCAPSSWPAKSAFLRVRTCGRVGRGHRLHLWAYANGITLDFSRPGKPTDNAYVESFNATVRLECLGQHWFLDLDDAREKVEEWRIESNEERPHSAIGDRTPLSLIHRPRHDAEASKTPEILT